MQRYVSGSFVTSCLAIALAVGCVHPRSSKPAASAELRYRTQPFTDTPVESLAIDDWDSIEESQVVVQGRANNGKVGALVELQPGRVRVEGLGAWPKDILGKTVQVQGGLIKQDFGTGQPMTTNAVGSQLRGRLYGIEHGEWAVVSDED